MRLLRLFGWFAVLAILVGLISGCVPSEDEGQDAPPATAARRTSTSARPPGTAQSGMSGKLPSPDASVQLDADTKQRCDALWGFGVTVYTAHLAKNPAPEERDRLYRGVAEYEPKATSEVPALAPEVKALAVYARASIESDPKLTPELHAANQRLVDYLRTSCKYKQT
jgi:hypothetical protein